MKKTNIVLMLVPCAFILALLIGVSSCKPAVKQEASAVTPQKVAVDTNWKPCSTGLTLPDGNMWDLVR